MRLLVLGGTAFLSKEVAAHAVAAGHVVVCACRGESGPVPDGARLVRWDRGAGEPAPVAEVGPVDAVVDVARQPSWVRSAVAAWSQAHWVFVSTISVYQNGTPPGGTPDTLPTHEALLEDDEDLEQYGPLKVGCEQLVREGTASSLVARPGLIVGPGDPSGRFTYWPDRLAEGGEVLAGGSPDDVVQVIDVRDLAAWLVLLAERRTTGVLDAVGPTLPLGELLADVAAGVDATDPTLTWVPGAVLSDQGVQPWAGPDSLPLWLPRPDYDGMLAHDPAPPAAAGLRCRPVSETARDTLTWLRTHPDTPRTGLPRDREAAVLAAWHSAR